MKISITSLISTILFTTNVFSQQISKSIDTVIAGNYPSSINFKSIRFSNTGAAKYLRMFDVDSSYRPFVDSTGIPGSPVKIIGYTNSPNCGFDISISRIVWTPQVCTYLLNGGLYFDVSSLNIYTAYPLPKASSDIKNLDTVIIPINAYFTTTSTEPVLGNPQVIRFYIKGIYNVWPGKINEIRNLKVKSNKKYYDLRGKNKHNYELKKRNIYQQKAAI